MRAGFSDKEIEAVLDRKGALTRGQLLHCRVRYLTDGLVLGSRTFVEDTFRHYRKEFGFKRPLVQGGFEDVHPGEAGFANWMADEPRIT